MLIVLENRIREVFNVYLSWDELFVLAENPENPLPSFYGCGLGIFTGNWLPRVHPFYYNKAKLLEIRAEEVKFGEAVLLKIIYILPGADFWGAGMEGVHELEPDERVCLKGLNKRQKDFLEESLMVCENANDIEIEMETMIAV